jgi:hypothetical protein
MVGVVVILGVQGNKGTQGLHHTIIYEIITNINLPNLKDGSSST